ncbi:uncharacterized protein [Anabrus simplex]|uniref:uncharacterized protein n=1 Tax=Anabrus simplex TaxID=316456 RepID=UPI0035A2AAE0
MALSREQRRRSLLTTLPETEQMVPPEGGWGWMVTLGMALMFISTTAQYSAFGLLFEGILDKLGAQTTGATVIMNALAAAVNFTGLVTNHLLQSMSYRMVAIIGGLLFALGVMLTIFTDSMVQIVITYSIISGVGLGLVAPSSYLAFNSYFSKRRALAMGLCQAAIGLGFIAAPPIIQLLLEKYGFRGTMLILGGIALNSVLGAMLYQPVQRHMLSCPATEDTDGMDDVPLGSLSKKTNAAVSVPVAEDTHVSLAVVPEEEDHLAMENANDKLTNGMNGINQEDMECDEHVVISRRGSLVMSAMLDFRAHRLLLPGDDSVYNSTVVIAEPNKAKRPTSASLVNFSSNVIMFDNSMAVADSPQGETMSLLSGIQRRKRQLTRHVDQNNPRWSLLQQIPDDESDDVTSSMHKEEKCSRWLQSISEFLDLSLLQDPVYVNIVIGLSVSFVSDANFFTVFPFFLNSLGFTGSDIALCMSVAAGADVVARLLLPWIASSCSVTPRTAYLVGCFTSAIARSVFASLEGGFIPMAVMSGVVGFLKGAMVVNLSLTIAQYCSLERFAAAYSLYMVINGMLTVTLGPLVGVLRDSTGSFPACIHVLSAGLLLCAFTWTVEYCVEWHRERNTSITHTLKTVFCPR